MATKMKSSWTDLANSIVRKLTGPQIIWFSALAAVSTGIAAIAWKPEVGWFVLTLVILILGTTAFLCRE